MTLIHIIETVHIQSPGKQKRKYYITATRINRKGDAGILAFRVPSVTRFLMDRIGKRA